MLKMSEDVPKIFEHFETIWRDIKSILSAF